MDAYNDAVMIACYWALFASFGLMLCTIAREDMDPSDLWQRDGTYRVADTDTLSRKERGYLLRPRPLYVRKINGRTEWRYRLDDEWVYPSEDAVKNRRMH